MKTPATIATGMAALALTFSSAAESTLVSQQVEADFEALLAGDVQLTQTGVSYGQKHGRWDWSAGLSWNSFTMDYQPAPFDFLGQVADLDVHRVSGQANAKVRLGEDFTLLGSAGAYDGFGNFRTVWLNEYFRQQFNLLPEYVPATPHGENVGVGLRWEYLPASAFIEGQVSYLHDEIAPGYEIDFAGLRRGRANLDTISVQLALENALTPRLRMRHEFRSTDTTDRENRLAWQGSLNLALGERWTLRATAGYTREEPTLVAHFYGGALEYAPAPGWSVAVTGRRYRDTGEIENSLFSTATPGLSAWQAGFALRRTWGDHTVRLAVAPYFTRHDPFGIGTAFFQNLYRNRDWVSVQFAYAADF